MPTYGHALVRVRLPGGLVLQAAFHPQEAVGAVLAEVRGCLSPTLQSAQPYLFVTPPRRVLDVSLSLAAAGLVPAATLLLGFDPPVSAGAAGSTPSEVLSARALALLAAPPDAAAAPQPSFPSAQSSVALRRRRWRRARSAARIDERRSGGGWQRKGAQGSKVAAALSMRAARVGATASFRFVEAQCWEARAPLIRGAKRKGMGATHRHRENVAYSSFHSAFVSPSQKRKGRGARRRSRFSLGRGVPGSSASRCSYAGRAPGRRSDRSEPPLHRACSARQMDQ